MTSIFEDKSFAEATILLEIFFNGKMDSYSKGNVLLDFVQRYPNEFWEKMKDGPTHANVR